MSQVPMKSIFVTGTDTDVGKTVVTAALISLLRGDGVNAVPMKPIQTGCDKVDGKLLVPDLEFVLSATGLTVEKEEHNRMCPYRFPLPCSPHLAAQKEHSAIDLEIILRCYQELAESRDMVVVEGAGGILVPIDDKNYMRELMVLLDAPVVLVARPGLGTLNHTLLSINELKRAGLVVAGVIFCETEPTENTYIIQDNKSTVERLGETAVLGTIPFISDLDRVLTSRESFFEFAQKSLPDALHVLYEVVEGA